MAQQQQPQEYYAAQKDNLLWNFFFLVELITLLPLSSRNTRPSFRAHMTAGLRL